MTPERTAETARVQALDRAGWLRLGQTRWRVQPDFILRSGGFPVADVLRLGDPELATAAVELDTDPFRERYAAAERQLDGEARDLAGDPLFLEAVTWQSPALPAQALHKLAAGAPMARSRHRRRVRILTSYLQRYTTKNDTIGFFGPVTWGRIVSDRRATTVRHGAGLLRSRSVFFEWWALDTVARVWSQDPEVRPWLRPRIAENWSVSAAGVRGPRGRRPELTEAEARVLAACDGETTVAGLCRSLSHLDVPELLEGLAERGLLLLDLAGPFEAHPERTLRAKLGEIADAPVRDRLVADLDALSTGRDRIARSAGDAAELSRAIAELDETFERITGAAASRRHGEAYAGRVLVYEETTRDVDLELGTAVLDKIADPLGMVMNSASWLVAEVAEVYARRFLEIHQRYQARTGSADMPLDVLVGAATPDLYFTRRGLPPLVAAQVARLREKWQRILDTPEGVSRHTVRAQDIAARWSAEFPAAPLRWSAARHHSPDILLVAADTAAVVRGEFTAVLGEIHLAMSNLDARPFVQTHPDPERLQRYAEASHGSTRVVPLPSRFSDQVTSRTYPPALLGQSHTYWSMYPHTTGAPGRIIPAADLVVRRDQDALTVTDLSDGTKRPLLEVVGEYLSAVLLNAFSLDDGERPHRPRVTIDDLVVAREAWVVPSAALPWPWLKEDSVRYQAACRWRGERGLPSRVFYRVAGQDKPLFLDFASPALVHLASFMIRGAGEEQPAGAVSFTELLPDFDHCWFMDAQGRRYASELRLVCADERL